VPSSVSSSAPEPAAGLRLFLAIEAPAALVAALGDLREPLGGCAWTPPERLHLTLRFIGEIPPALLPPLRERLRTIRGPRFVLRVAGVGVFPPLGTPRVLWCGVGSGQPRLLALHRQLDDVLHGLGLPGDPRVFVPHITLARLGAAPPERVAAWLHRRREFAAEPFPVEGFALFASELRPGGAVHTWLEPYALGAS